ncbi:MAG: hypothetical protein WCG26_15295 [Chloroflexales bacterium]
MHSARNPFTLDVFGLPSDPLTALDLVLAGALTLGGAGHVLLAPIAYRHESAQNQLWFAGSGLALMFLGMLNLARVRGDDAETRRLSKVANPAGAVFLLLLAARLRERQTVAALALSVGLTALALRK